MKLVSLFTGAGGLDLGFHQAGFQTIWANEFDKKVQPTYRLNFPDVELDCRSITAVPVSAIPSCDGIIGGPPCQSWSIAGASRGISDARGQLFLDYIRILEAKQPKFFLAENVPGITHVNHREAFASILADFEEAGYDVTVTKVNANDYGVAQTRERIIIVGYRKDLNLRFVMPKAHVGAKPVLRDVIWDLRESALPGVNRTRRNPELDNNHEYYSGNFTGRYMSRNRVRDWDSPSFTMVSNPSGLPAHPDSGKMIKLDRDHHLFEFPEKARRFSVRETARIQSFPDSFKFVYDVLENGYKMTGNAVPPLLAKNIAHKIQFDLKMGELRDEEVRALEEIQRSRELFVAKDVKHPEKLTAFAQLQS